MSVSRVLFRASRQLGVNLALSKGRTRAFGTMAAHPVKKVAVIGAGPCGLAAAKFLRAEKFFDKIDVFEQRSEVGGVWNYSTPQEKASSELDIPQTNAHPSLEGPVWRRSRAGGKEATFISPVYGTLETNIPKTLMAFSDHPFPKDCQVFPLHQQVESYLIDYAKEIRHLIQLQVQVVDVKPALATEGSWQVSRKYLGDDQVKTDDYDAVVVASGHFNVPYIPSIPGIAAWNKAYPGVISHAKQYDSPDSFKNKKVIVVGNSASGVDIGAQVAEVCQLPLLVSSLAPASFPERASQRVDYPAIEVFLNPDTDDRAVKFTDGRIETGIDAIIFCTGYLYSYPFLEALSPPVITNGARTHGVYKQLFYIERPTLAFPVLHQRVVPFPQAENQSAVLSRVWSGRLRLPPKEEMLKHEEDRVAQRGSGGDYHTFPFPADAEYLNDMYKWAESAERREGLENDGRGKLGTYWGAEDYWARENFPAMRTEFARRGVGRHSICSLEELGFVFEKEKEALKSKL